MPIAMMPKSETWRPTFNKILHGQKAGCSQGKERTDNQKGQKDAGFPDGKQALSRRFIPPVPEITLVVACP